MAKTLQLTIPNACHESWHTMTAVEKGRYCMSCRKNVIDFTNMSDREILQHIGRSPGNVCGRLHNDQLDRNITMQKESRLPWLKYFFQFTLPAFFVSMKAEAQDCKKPVIEQVYRQKSVVEEMPAGRIDPNAWVIEGRVLDDSIPIAGASVIVKGTTKGSFTDSDGYFRLAMPGNEDVVLSVSSIGYQSIELRTKPSKESEDVSIKMIPLQIRLDEAVTVGLICTTTIKKPRKPSALEVARSIITPDSVRIFPNPIGLGNNLEMELKVKQPGSYYVQVTDFNGRLVIKEEVQANAKFFKASIDAKQLLAGRYIVCVRNSKGKKIGVKKIIVQ